MSFIYNLTVSQAVDIFFLVGRYVFMGLFFDMFVKGYKVVYIIYKGVILEWKK